MRVAIEKTQLFELVGSGVFCIGRNEFRAVRLERSDTWTSQ